VTVYICEAMLWTGWVGVTVGLWLIHPAAGLIGGGLLLLAGGIALAKLMARADDAGRAAEKTTE
jgi:membrane-associated protease RseP (regulator of RpoE activity)